MQSKKNHVRHCLLYEFRLGHTAADAYRNLRSVLGEGGPCERICRYWFEKLNYNGQEFRNQAEVKYAIKTFFDFLLLSFFVTVGPPKLRPFGYLLYWLATVVFF